jgi:hypothetical protein
MYSVFSIPIQTRPRAKPVSCQTATGLLLGIKRSGLGVDPVPGLRMSTALCHLAFWRETLLLWYVVVFNIVISHMNMPDLQLATSLFH